MTDKLYSQVQQIVAEYEKREAEGLEKARHAIDEMARLWKDSISAAAQIQASLRHLFVPEA